MQLVGVGLVAEDRGLGFLVCADCDPGIGSSCRPTLTELRRSDANVSRRRNLDHAPLDVIGKHHGDYASVGPLVNG
jgi:hypothetical protein